MKIQVYVAGAPGEIVRRTREAPTLGPDDLLVAVEAAVVAGPELRALERGGDRAPGGAAVGTVVSAGDAAGDMVGRRLLVGPLAACAECDACRRGRLTACAQRARLGLEVDGALATHVVARRRWSTALAGPLDGVAPGPQAAALAREAPLAYALLARAGVAPGDVTVWLGGGAVARYGLALARSRGALAVSLTSAELALPPAELATALAQRVFADNQAPPATWRIFETTGTAAGRQRAAGLAASGATLALVSNDAAGSDADDPLPLAPALDRDVTIVAVAAAHPDLVPEVAALAAKGDFDPGEGVHVRPIDELGALVQELRAGGLAGQLAVVTSIS